MTNEITSSLLQQAKENLIAGEYDQAIKAAKGVIALDSDNSEASDILTASLAASGGGKSVEDAKTSPELDALSRRLDLARTNRDLFLVDSDIKKFISSNQADPTAAELLTRVSEKRENLTGVTSQPSTPPVVAGPAPGAATAATATETTIYEGNASVVDIIAEQGILNLLVLGFGLIVGLWLTTYTGWVLVVDILLILGYLLAAKMASVNFHVKITSQRVEITQGVFSKTIETIELYRGKDTGISQGALQSMVGSGSMSLISDDSTAPAVWFIVHSPRQIQEKVRKAIREQRLAMGTTARI